MTAHSEISTVKDGIRQFLMSHRASESATAFSDDESLLEAGVIDSVAMLDLIAYLEKSFGIKVDEDEMTPENFDSLNAIVAYVRSKA